MKIAVTGHKGRLGSWLVEQAGCVALKCDITKPDEIQREMERASPDVVVNCAAWTEVDDAENRENYDEVMAINLRGPANVRRAFDGLLIQISTGFVFSGRNGPYDEEALPEPVNLYGWSKFGGESAAQIRKPTVIVRVLDLFGPTRNGKTDFVRQVRDALELGVEKELPDKLFGSPTYIPHLSEALMEIATRWGYWKMAPAGYEPPGIIHVTGNLTLSRFDWGRKIAEGFGYNPELIQPTSEIVGLAPRPLRGGLNVGLAKSIGLPIYSPLDGLADLRKREHASGEDTTL